MISGVWCAVREAAAVSLDAKNLFFLVLAMAPGACFATRSGWQRSMVLVKLH